SAPKAGDDDFSIGKRQLGQSVGGTLGRFVLIAQALEPVGRCRFFAMSTSAVGPSTADRPPSHCRKEPSHWISRHLAAASQINERLLHDVVTRLAPLPGI